MQSNNINLSDITDSTEEVPPKKRLDSKTHDSVFDNLTSEQRNRDEATTELYKQFVEAHREKGKFSSGSKRAIRTCCIVWISLLFATCISLSAYIFFGTSRQATDIITLIGTIVPLVAAIIGTLNIMTKYVFPADEERHITDIVKLIHENDLLNKRENTNING